VTAEDRYRAGLRAGWIDESHGILEPESGYPDDDPYLRGVKRGRAAWRREVQGALVVDRPPIRLAELPDPEPLTPDDVDRLHAESAGWRSECDRVQRAMEQRYR